jgi:hypothetical protein
MQYTIRRRSGKPGGVGRADGRVERCMVPIGDGLTIVRTAA